MGRFDRILERENRPPTSQTRVLEKKTRRRPPEKSDRVRSAAAGGSGCPGLWTALAYASMFISSYGRRPQHAYACRDLVYTYTGPTYAY